MATGRKIQLVRIAHVYYKHKNLEKANEFYEDFGFSKCHGDLEKKRIYYRGYGTEPFSLCAEEAEADEFGGAGFVVESEDDLRYAVQNLPSATDIYDLDAPGGGKCVTFRDPVDDFPFHLVFGQTSVPTLDPGLKKREANLPNEKPRPAGDKQRFKKGPAPVHKLGHFGVCTTNYTKMFKFYSDTFNFYPSEIIHLPIEEGKERKDVTVFFRLDLGETPVDHHCFFFFEGPKYHVHHSSFETHDFDTQQLGHDWLRKQKKYENCWGVGRHIMGSQIFDYWFDPSRFIMEHYADGDLVNNTEKTHENLASPDNLHVWGPDLPPTFLT